MQDPEKNNTAAEEAEADAKSKDSDIASLRSNSLAHEPNDKSPPTETTTTTTTQDIEKEAAQPPPTPQQIPFSRPHTLALVTTLTGAAFLNTLTLQACVITLPQISTALHIPAARQQWIISAYSLTFGCFLLLWGRLADVYGKRLIFIAGSAWLCLMTLLCPFIPSEIGFDVFRGLQGLGAAANVPTAIGILGVTFPPGKARTYAFAAYSAGAPMGSVCGNLLGGVLGEYANWKWVFWVLAMLAGILTLAGWSVIPVPRVDSTKEKVKNAVDWPGGILITLGLVILLFALTEGNVVGWSTPWIPVLIVVSVLLIAAFVLWQLYLEKKTTSRPLMKVTIFKNLQVSAAMAMIALVFGSFNNFLVFATYFYQDYQGYSAILTTVRFIPTGVVGVCVVLVMSQLLARVDVQYLMMFGSLAAAIGGLLFAVPIPPSTTYWAYGLESMSLYVFGADTVFPSSLLIISQALPREDQAIGGATLNAMGQIGRALGLAIATAIQVQVQESQQGGSGQSAVVGGSMRGNPAFLSGIRAAEWLNFAFGLLAFFIATFAFRGAGKVGAVKK